MKQIIIIFLVLNVNPIFAQQWKPIHLNEKYNYSINNSRIYESIYVDSLKIENNDSIFFLNKAYKKDTTVITYCGSMPYLNYYFTKRSSCFPFKLSYLLNGEIRMKDSLHNFLLKPLSNINDSWIFDSVNNITIQIANLKDSMIFGNIDSIKVMKLSNNDSIIISKKYGILMFPLFDSLHQHYTLVGIESMNKGIVIPIFEDFYDFTMGDIFSYLSEASSPYYNIHDYKNIYIKSKYVNGDTIKYMTDIKCLHIYNSTANNDTTITIIYDTLLTYINNSDHFLNTNNNQISFYKTNEYKLTIVSSDSTFDVLTKQYHFNYLEPTDQSLDTLINHNNEVCIYDYSSCKYGKTLGLLSYNNTTKNPPHYTTSTTNSYNLIGYKRNGIIHGTVFSDSIFISIHEYLFDKSTFHIYPNPIDKEIFIENKNNTEKTNITLFDLNGETLLSKTLIYSKTILDVSFLKSGLYIMKLSTSNKFEIKIIIKK